MIHNILVPIDDSLSAIGSMKFAAMLGRIFGAKITGLILEKYLFKGTVKVRHKLIPDFDELKSKTIHVCEEVAQQADLPFETIPCRTKLKRGITRKTEDFDLIVVSASGNLDNWGKGLLQSQLARVIKKTPLPIVITPVPFELKADAIRNVVLAYDGRERVTSLFDITRSLCQKVNAKLTIVTIDDGKRKRPESIPHDIQGTLQDIEWTYHHVDMESGEFPALGIFRVLRDIRPELLAIGLDFNNHLLDRIHPNTTRTIFEMAPVPLLVAGKKRGKLVKGQAIPE